MDCFAALATTWNCRRDFAASPRQYKAISESPSCAASASHCACRSAYDQSSHPASGVHAEVSSPNGLFLITRSFIPTHNSSLGRLGLLIHSTAGFIDPGWDGHVTLELSNVANLPITIYPEMKIGQLSFVQMTEPADAPYGSGALGSKYQGQKGPTPSRYYRNFE